MIIFFIRYLSFPRNLAPIKSIDIWERYIAGNFCMHLGQINSIYRIKYFGIHSRTTNYDKFLCTPRLNRVNHAIKRPKYLNPIRRKPGITADDKIGSSWQRSTNRLKRFPSHYYRFPHRNSLEIFEVARKSPRQSSVFSDNTVFGNGYD